MSTIRGIQVQDTQKFQYEQLTAEQVRARTQLFTGDTVEQARSIDTGNERVALPTFEPTDRQVVVDLLKNADPDAQKALLEIGNQVAQGLSSAPSDMVAAGNVPAGLQNDLNYAFEQYVVTQGETNSETAMQGVMQLAVSSAEGDVLDFANNLQGNLDAKQTKREEIADFRDQLADTRWPADENATMPFDVPGQEEPVQMTKAQAEGHVEDLEGELSTMADMTQMMQMQLQDAMNKQAQAMQTLSAILKTLHETAMAIIRKISG